jgi:hypothetical protein
MMRVEFYQNVLIQEKVCLKLTQPPGQELAGREVTKPSGQELAERLWLYQKGLLFCGLATEGTAA